MKKLIGLLLFAGLLAFTGAQGAKAVGPQMPPGTELTITLETDHPVGTPELTIGMICHDYAALPTAENNCEAIGTPEAPPLEAPIVYLPRMRGDDWLGPYCSYSGQYPRPPSAGGKIKA